MAKSSSNHSIDPNNGFCAATKTFHSLIPVVPLPPGDLSLSVTEFAFSLCRNSSSPETTALIDSTTGHRLSYADIIRRTESLAASLQIHLGLSKGDVAFVLAPACLQIPVLYLSLLAIGIVISPANPISTVPEISRLIELCKPVIAFATSDTASKLPHLRKRTVLIDSPEFESMMTIPAGKLAIGSVEVKQLDTAAIFYSSGTTGLMKGVMVSYRNMMNNVAKTKALRPPAGASRRVVLFTLPLFHGFGFSSFVKLAVAGETVVLVKKFDARRVIRAIEEFKVTDAVLAPPVLVALTKDDAQMDGCDLSSWKSVLSGGAPVGKEMAARFKSRFPDVIIAEGYGMTEMHGGVAIRLGSQEGVRLDSVGRLTANVEAKIVDPESGIALPPCTPGELWVRGPMVMKGYAGDEVATSASLTADGWLRTGDLCYIDHEGYLFIVDRLKELIKYKGYQVPPVELEMLLHSHPDIIDAAVVPYPSEEAGQVPMAFVVRRNQSTLNEAQVMDFVDKQVAPYKKIRRVSFITFIPKNATGKTLRKELIKLALASPPSKL